MKAWLRGSFVAVSLFAPSEETRLSISNEIGYVIRSAVIFNDEDAVRIDRQS